MTDLTDPSQTEVLEKHVVKETKESFSHKVEELVWMKDIDYLDAVQELSETMNLEPETVGNLLTKDLYAKLEEEAENLYLLKSREKKNRLQV